MPCGDTKRRRHGEVCLTLLDAVVALVTIDRAPTERELSSMTQIGRKATQRALAELVRHGDLQVARRRKVDYSSKPVAEYAPPEPVVLPFAGILTMIEVMPQWVASAVIDRQSEPQELEEREGA